MFWFIVSVVMSLAAVVGMYLLVGLIIASLVAIVEKLNGGQFDSDDVISLSIM